MFRNIFIKIVALTYINTLKQTLGLKKVIVEHYSRNLFILVIP